MEFIDYLLAVRDRIISRGGINFHHLKTIYLFSIHLRKLFCWLHTNGIKAVNEISVQRIKDYPKLKGASSFLRRFFKFCTKQKYILYNPMSGIKFNRDTAPKFPPTLSKEQEFSLFRLTRDSSAPISLRLVILLTLLHGLSSTQIRFLKIDDIDVATGYINIQSASGQKQLVILDSEELDIIFNYVVLSRLSKPLANQVGKDLVK